MPRFFSLLVFVLSFGFATELRAQTDSSTNNLMTNAIANRTASEVKLRFRTDVVSLEATVVNQQGVPVVGLGQEQFEIYEDGVLQQIEYFRLTDSPASIGVIFDISGSMQFSLKEAQEAFRSFLAVSHPDDEFFLLLVNEKPQLVTDFTDGATLLSKVSTLQAQGNTALRDAMAWGMKKLEQSKYSKRALLVISDGVDNHSRLGAGKLLNQMKESAAQIYTIGTADFRGVTCDTLCRLGAQQLLESSARQTGGEAFFLTSRQSLEDVTSRIAVLLRQQYSVGYVPTNQANQGRWRKVEVKVKEGGQKTIVRSRKGYYEARFEE